jgi:hypothetical protein
VRLPTQTASLLGGGKRSLRVAFPPLQRPLVQRPPDGLGQAYQPILQEIIGSTTLENLDRGSLADTAGHNEKRDIERASFE